MRASLHKQPVLKSEEYKRPHVTNANTAPESVARENIASWCFITSKSNFVALMDTAVDDTFAERGLHPERRLKLIAVIGYHEINKLTGSRGKIRSTFDNLLVKHLSYDQIRMSTLRLHRIFNKWL